MDNEVVIIVRAEDETDKGFASARAKAKSFTADVDNQVRQVGPKIGDGLGGGMLAGLKTSLPAFGQFGIAAGAAMAPLLGSVVGAAMIGGAGAAGILGGLKVAANDPAVKAAGTKLKEELGKDLKDAASSFVPVALQSLDKLKAGFKDILPDLKSIFSTSSTFVGPLLDSSLSGIKKLVSGVEDAVEQAGPIFEAVGRVVETTLSEVGETFTDLSDDTENFATAVDALAPIITGTIEVFEALLEACSETVGAFKSLGEGIGELGLDLGLLEKQTAKHKIRTYEAADASKAAAAATEQQRSELRKLGDEMISQTDPLFGLLSAQRDVTDAQKDYNEALRKHGPRSAETREALAELGQAAFRLQDKVGDAAGGFNGKLTPAMRTALSNAGLTTGQMDKLERELRNAAKAASDWEGTYRQKYVTSYVTNYSGPKEQLPYGTGRAHGGPVGAVRGAQDGALSSGMTLVGEQGPELLSLPAGTQVHTNADTRRMMSEGRGMGGGEMRIVPDFARLDGVTRALLEMLRFEIRAQGGNVQTVLGS